MSSIQPRAYPATIPAETAEDLRAFLLGHPVFNGAADGCMRSVPAGLMDVREAAPRLLILPAPPWSHPELRFRVRTEVAERLRAAIDVLPDDIRLGFWEGLRPISIQRRLWTTGLTFMQEAHPELSLAQLELALEPFVARPEGAAPPHSTGSAVDVAAVDVFGRVMNPADAFGRLGNGVVARALTATGMARYEPEWWHWSYGDEEWARAYDCQPLAFAGAPEFDGPGGGI